MGSIVYDVRLPKDPPRTFDINRLTTRMLHDASTTTNMTAALTPICKLIGLDNDDGITLYYCSGSDWSAASPALRLHWLVSWLIVEDDNRHVKQ